ncbi:hypothetical protein C162_03157 [Paenibacillus sp. FSL R7-269]|uniref:hypothetical protein n=1 Tax=Paenibacillus sp. FSL R7-269 TaxID=1226755 RepID=UPI0003E2917C|nr:hypothetical protein [Paenibacillus sp. FSL R7-269]ETT55421.1 hypothetical protein C162_03157 [Paenibacillus sp. FSL R7-269]
MKKNSYFLKISYRGNIKKKPLYKKFNFWIIVIFLGGTIGLITAGEESGEPSAPAVTEEAQPTAAAVATEAPTEKPTEVPVATEAPQAKVPAFEIVEERLDKSGMWYVTVSTKSTDPAELKALVENGRLLALERNNDATCVFTEIQHPDGTKANIAVGKIALSENGLARQD